MWDRVAHWMTRHPKTGGRLFVMVAISITAYVILAFLLGTIRQSQRDGCDRGNSRSLGDLRAASGEITFASDQQTYWRIKGDSAQVHLWGDKIGTQEDKIASLKAVAASSDYPSAEDAVTVACDRIYPNPLPLPGL